MTKGARECQCKGLGRRRAPRRSSSAQGTTSERVAWAFRSHCCITFEGGGGHVSVTASQEGDKTELVLETREWDYHVKTFMRQV